MRLIFNVEYVERKRAMVAIDVNSPDEAQNIIETIRKTDDAEIIINEDPIVFEDGEPELEEFKIDALPKIFYGIFIVEDFHWDLVELLDSKDAAIHVFNKHSEEMQKHVKIEQSGPDFNIFEDGTEIWVVEGAGIANNTAFVVIGEDGEGFKIEGVFPSYIEARHWLANLKREYMANGYNVSHEYEDLITFNNDDTYKISTITVSKGDKK